ncbi:phospholipid carrier-dependent glycosyltransferase [Bdellovibrionota bacterium FG-1]
MALYLLSQIFFLINIQFPRGHNFDEFHYVPSAKQWLAWKENQNWEHPPLAKLVMAVGISLWGDIPIGWRFMSTIFGAFTLVGMYLWGLVLFESEATALWIALVTLFNQLLYVQSRIGMLDTFMFAGVVWGLAAFTATWRAGISPALSRKLLLISGVCLGLGMACKWFAVMPWVMCLGLIALVRLFQRWNVQFSEPTSEDWYSPDLWKGVRGHEFALTLFVVPVLIYFATFTPYFFLQKPAFGFWDLFLTQKKMYEGQLRVVTQHPYMSNWLDWPLIRRPIWYAFDKEGGAKEWVRGVLLIGNPLVMWGGCLALLGCLWGWIEKRSRQAFLILVFYFTFYGCWILIPRKIAFYYYYYPAGMVLSFALAYAFELIQKTTLSERFQWISQARWAFLACVLVMFVYFFPIIAALRISSETFRDWMWFRSWI